MYDAQNLWDTIDKIAERKQLTLPALALSAGLDQSTFSRARRKRNWPSLQTICKLLNAHGIPLTEWAGMVDNRPKKPRPQTPQPLKPTSFVGVDFCRNWVDPAVGRGSG